MDGIAFHRRSENDRWNPTKEATRLLAKQDGFEVMLLSITADSVVWLTPADDQNAVEFFFVHEGAMELAMDNGVELVSAGEAFSVHGLKSDVPARIVGNTSILSATNRPSFESVQRFEESLISLLKRINEKDHYTYRHSGAVLRYSLDLYDALPHTDGDVSRDELAMAALFHDVGKCFIPAEVLQKTTALESSELRYILRHPLDSGRMLRGEFGERVAEVAMNHHERLDGSGYPRGLTAEDISLQARIVSVADVFDAMTSERGYNVVKPFETAAKELCEMNEQFDPAITRTLYEMVQNGSLTAEEADENE